MDDRRSGRERRGMFDTPSHPHSPLGDQRERSVPCQRCRRMTWNWCAMCNEHCTCTPEDGKR